MNFMKLILAAVVLVMAGAQTGCAANTSPARVGRLGEHNQDHENVLIGLVGFDRKNILVQIDGYLVFAGNVYVREPSTDFSASFRANVPNRAVILVSVDGIVRSYQANVPEGTRTMYIANGHDELVYGREEYLSLD